MIEDAGSRWRSFAISVVAVTRDGLVASSRRFRSALDHQDMGIHTNPRNALLGITGLGIDGGIASVARCVARAIDGCVDRGNLDRADRVLLLDDPSHPPAPPSRGDQLFSNGRQGRFVWQLWRKYQQHRPGLVFFDQLGIARSVQLPMPGFPPPRYAVFCHGIELGRAHTGTAARAVSGAWRLLTNSEHTARTVRAQFPESADRVRVVPLCIDPRRVEVWERLAPTDNPAPRQPAVMIVGRMWSEERGKGHNQLLECWPAVVHELSEAELWIIGDGNDRPQLEDRVKALGIESSVRFLGRVSDEELSRRYRTASVFAMPSRQEGFGLVYSEAMLHGLPCIASTFDAGAEVVEEGKTGLLVPYGDPAALGGAILSILRNPTHARELGQAARRQARERFGYERFRDDLLEALELA